MNKQRRTYRLWQDLEDKLETLAKQKGTTPAKMLNIVLTEALKDVTPDNETPADEPLPDIARHDAFS